MGQIFNLYREENKKQFIIIAICAALAVALVGYLVIRSLAADHVIPQQSQLLSATEASGAVASRTYPNVYWWHRDGGKDKDPNNPRNAVYAIKFENGTMVPVRDGKYSPAIKVEGVGKIQAQWEDMAMDNNNNIYIGDIGFASCDYPSTIYRINEPNPYTSTSVNVAASYTVDWPKGASNKCHPNSEIMTWIDGHLYIMLKQDDTPVYRVDLPNGNSGHASLTKITEFKGRTNLSYASVSDDHKLMIIGGQPRMWVFKSSDSGLRGDAFVKDVAKRGYAFTAKFPDSPVKLGNNYNPNVEGGAFVHGSHDAVFVSEDTRVFYAHASDYGDDTTPDPTTPPTTPPPTPGPTPPPTPNPTPLPVPTGQGMRVQGNQFLRDGVAFTPRGFNMVGVLSPPGCTNGMGVNARNHFNQAEMDAAKSWKANTLRFQVSQVGLSTTNTANLESYIKQIKDSVALAHANGFTTILSMQDQAIGCGKVHPMASDATVTAWSNLAPQFAQDPNTMFELFNEPRNDPNTGGWNQWLNGGKTPLANLGDTAVGHQALLDGIRALGANNVVLADGASLAEQLQGIPKLQDATNGRGVAYAVHPYYYTMSNPRTAWEDRYGYLTSTVPVLATEWYYAPGKCGTDAETSAPTFLAYLIERKIGVLGQAFDIPDTTIADWAWTPTACKTTHPGSGQVFKDHLAKLATLDGAPTPTPNPTPGPSTTEDVTLTADADTYISSERPGNNYNNTDPLRATNTTNHAYLRFKTSGIAPSKAVATSVQLRLFVTQNKSQSGGFQVHPQSNSWAADKITWKNRPALNSQILATSTTPKAGSWTTIKLPLSAISEDGDTSFVVTYSLSNSASQFSSRENVKNKPKLVISYASTNTSSDTMPPSVPTNLSATASSSTTVKLTWGASTDNVGVDKYVILRNNVAIASVGPNNLAYTDTTALPGTKQDYQVVAFDAANNQSLPSNTASVTTPGSATPDTTAPSAPGSLKATLVSASQVTLSWNASTDNVGVAGYEVYRGGIKVATVLAPATTYGEGSLTANSTYEYFVRAYDAVGNRSTNSNSVQVKTQTAQNDPVIAAAGDIATAKSSNGSAQTANLILNLNPSAVLTMGDSQYENGAAKDYKSYFDTTWGRFKSLIHPSPGHHEYYTDHTAAGYYGYFGSAANNSSQPNCKSNCKGYYSFDVGNWHLIALNTNHYKTSAKQVCAYVACNASSEQIKWLKADLAKNTKQCVLAYWADPRWASGTRHGSNDVIGDIWSTLYDAHVDLALNGHEHHYERFDKQNPSGKADTSGIREIIAGTGGNELYPFGTPKANSQVRNNTSNGILKLTLHSDSYTWQFVPSTGNFTDSGTTNCNK